MNLIDGLQFTWRTLSYARLRTALMLLAMAVGVASVIVLTALGEGARNYVSDQFSSMGTNLLIVIPGRTETTGGSPSTFVGETTRELTLDDAVALRRSTLIKNIAPLVVGAAPVSYKGLEREVPVFGSTAALADIQDLQVAQGRFLPSNTLSQAVSVCVIGLTVKKELFGNASALGKWLRIGDRRFRVIGVMQSKGRSIGMDMDDMVIVPVKSAQVIFNTSSVFRIFVSTRSPDDIEQAKRRIIEIIKQRHQGEEDITVITQDALLTTFNDIFKTLTLAVTGIAAISLFVAGILVMNVMLISVSQRTSEIGLFKALGAPPQQIRNLFLGEAVLLSLLGAVVGVFLGYAGSSGLTQAFPDVNFSAPWWASFAAISVAILSGIIFGVSPANRAAKLDPVQALSGR
ncbi:MAG: ABC transporter permease [Gammaproteobacteria bacterium]|nr:ABC transporter permease [Gammaproteobacteria bacterium]